MLDYAYFDGEFIASDRPVLKLDDRGFHFGDGLFETILVQGGHALFLMEHLARMQRGMSALDLDADLDTDKIRGVLGVLVERNGVDTMLAKLVIWRNGEADLLTPATSSSRVAIICRHVPDYPAQIYEAGVEVITMTIDRSSMSDIKALCYLPNMISRQKAAANGAFEALMVTRSGIVEEGSICNLLLVRHRMVVIPSHEKHILAGVTQGQVARIAGELGWAVREDAIYREELFSADELMLTNTSAGIVPVVSVDGRLIGAGVPGAMTIKLSGCYRERVKRQIFNQ